MLRDELVAELYALNRAEKLRVVQLLVNDLAADTSGEVLEHGAVYEVWSPYDAAGAAETLEKMLLEHKKKSTHE
ncbi:MAG: hypothetical protein K8L91_09935 [Anaerolineae bacterium]|nr:hypothetical protein [Anaerolineae bacterium]